MLADNGSPDSLLIHQVLNIKSNLFVKFRAFNNKA